MTVKSFFRIVLGSIFVLLSALAVMAGLLVLNHRQYLADQHAWRRSMTLAEQLRRSGDDLTRFARSFAVTGDPQYEQYYSDAHAIYNGTKQIPAQYIGRIYWEFVVADEKEVVLDENLQAVSLRTLMRDSSFTAEELAKLQDAEEASAQLVRIEQIAIHAMHGQFDDGTGKFTREGPVDQALATQLMYSPEYLLHRAKMMRPIDDVLGMLEIRLTANMQQSTHRQRIYLIVIFALIIVLVWLVLFSGRVIFQRICVPIAALQHQTRLVGEDLRRLAQVTTGVARGDLCSTFVTEAKIQGTHATDDIGELSRMHDAMIADLQAAGMAISGITADLSQQARLLNFANEDLRDVNQGLELEIAARREAEDRIQQLNESLEQRVCDRTADLVAAKTEIELANR
jgi:hypothetical protein